MEKDEDAYFNKYSFLLDRTSRRVKQYAKKQFKDFDFGITVDQWIILRELDQNENLSQSELARLTFKDTPTLTRIVDLLCEKGLAERQMDQQDRRKFIVQLTKAGQCKVKELNPHVASIRKKAWENLKKSDFEHFKYVLDTIYQNLSTENKAPENAKP